MNCTGKKHGHLFNEGVCVHCEAQEVKITIRESGAWEMVACQMDTILKGLNPGV